MPKDTISSKNTQAVLLGHACMPVMIKYDGGVRLAQGLCGQALPVIEHV